jgi:hypothetical protein
LRSLREGPRPLADSNVGRRIDATTTATSSCSRAASTTRWRASARC